MITLTGICGLSLWFYISARKTGKSGFLWMFIGIIMYLVLAILFLKFGQLYLTGPASWLASTLKIGGSDEFIELITLIFIFVYGYMIYGLFLRKDSGEL